MALPEVRVKEVVWYRVDCSARGCGFVYQSTDKEVSLRVARGHHAFHRIAETK